MILRHAEPMNTDKNTMVRETFYQQIPDSSKDAPFKVITDFTEDN
jgi:hypothetical protein